MSENGVGADLAQMFIPLLDETLVATLADVIDLPLSRLLSVVPKSPLIPNKSIPRGGGGERGRLAARDDPRCLCW
jgi:hypothetical protein